MKKLALGAYLAAAVLVGCGGGGAGAAFPVAPAASLPEVPVRAAQMHARAIIPVCPDLLVWCTKADATAQMAISTDQYSYDSCAVPTAPGCPQGPQLKSVGTSFRHALAQSGSTTSFDDASSVRFGSWSYNALTKAKSPAGNLDGGTALQVGGGVYDAFTIESKTLKRDTAVTLLFTIVLTPVDSTVECDAGNGTAGSMNVGLFAPSVDPERPIVAAIVGECQGETFVYKTLSGKDATDTEALITGKVGKFYQFGFVGQASSEAESGCNAGGCTGLYGTSLRGVARMTIEVTTPGAYISTASGYRWQ